MADLALPTLPVATVPILSIAPGAVAAMPIVGDLATGQPADPFASLIAALAPATAVPATPTVAALPTPDAIALPIIGADTPATDLPAKAIGDDQPDGDATTPVSDVVAMLTFVPPPAIVPVAVAPATVIPKAATPAIIQSADAPAPRAPTLAIAPPVQAKPAPPIDAATPTTVAEGPPPSAAPAGAGPAAEIVRLLKAGVSPVALAESAPEQKAATSQAQAATPAAQPAPAGATPQAIVAAEVAAPTLPSAPTRRAAPVGPRAAPVAKAEETAVSEAPAPERRTEARHARADAATPAPVIAARPDPTRPADTAVIAPAVRTDDPIARQLDMAKDGQWLDTLAKDIAMAGGKDGQLSFRLDPASLGALTVQIMQGDDGASVRLSASTEQARAILADAQPRLVAEARAQGLHLREATVDTAPVPAPASSNTNTGGGGQARGEQGASAQLQQHQQQQGGRRAPAQPQADATPRRTPATTPARDSAELYA